MAFQDEDIFGVNVTEIIIRFHQATVSAFDKNSNKYPFEHFKQLLTSAEYDCYFTRQSDSEHKIIIPFTDLNEQLEIVTVWHNTLTYEAKVNRKKKTRLVSPLELPEKKYRIESRCAFRLIDIDELYDNFDTLGKLNSLKKRIDKLEIAPKTLIENQRSTWTKYIQAQEILIKKLQEPFICKSYEQPVPIKNNNGDIIRFKFKINLVTEQNDEYKIFEDELKTLEINESFRSDGTIYLTLDEIFRGLDSIIKRKFAEVFEREKPIGAILKVKPLNIAQKINSLIPQARVTCSSEFRQVWVSGFQGDQKELYRVLSSFGFYHSKSAIDFTITNCQDLRDNFAINKKHAITFGKIFSRGDNVKELLLPEPVNGNTFHMVRPVNRSEEFYSFKAIISRIYGKENVAIKNISYIFDAENSERIRFSGDEFTHEFWTDIKRELYLIGFDVTVSENDQALYFEFSDRNDLAEKFDALKGLNKFKIIKSPLDEDFKFKVKTNLIAKKSIKQIFQEKLEKLKGVEFVYDKAKKEDKKNDFVFIGKLSFQESNSNQLIFNIPYHFSDEKKEAASFFKFLESNPVIQSVQANLKGDEAKTRWLREAMEKLNENAANSDKPNKKPVNLKIRDFIFDSSKAEPIFKFDFTPIEETEEYKNAAKYEILDLNDSQRKSILRALYASDLCLLQGPPGTGKTTVIAELIWQLIRQNPTSRILLTSETNLAVDNALEKLMSSKNINPELARYISVIKPLRFGKSAKFEEEGKKYSVDRILEWLEETIEKETDYENVQLDETSEEEEDLLENSNNNIIQNWMIRIADRSKSNDPKYAGALKDWVIELSQPSKQSKILFKEKYFKYVNVIGSTCSSTGSPAFSKDYQSTFNANFNKSTYKIISEIQFLMAERPGSRKIFSLIEDLGLDIENPRENDFENLKSALNNILNIRFDTVIMDEASKATPPDLLLPLCFGKKSVVIGDHRQLPPLLNEKDFKETLLDLQDEQAKKLAEDIDKEFIETSQFKRLILNPSVSHTIKSTFNVQYRMHPLINDVISQFYLDDECGGLICGLDPSRVNNSDLNDPQSRYHGLFHDGFINDSVHTIWVDVDEPEIQDGTSRVNELEIEAIKRVLSYLKNSQGFTEYMKHWNKIKDEEKRILEKEVGIISFYGKQVSKLREARTHAKKLEIPIRLKTVDKFQGMERNIIIVSTVRSDKLNKGNDIIEPNFDIGFAKAPERLNVALSRARRLLIVVGNKNFFYRFKDRQGVPIYKNAIDVIAKSGRIINYKALDKYIDK